MAETVNLPRDSTLRELVAVQKASIIASGNAAAIDRLYGSLVRAAKSVEEVNTLFVDWWNICWKEGVTTRNELCGRWFGTVLDDNRVHGTKEPLFATSQSAIGEATDDSVGLVCTPSTEAAANRDDFAKLPQFWALEVAAEKNADGTHTIYAVEFIDSYDDVRRSKHLCWVLQKNTYTKEWDEGGYRYFKMRCHPSTGYEMWPQGTDKNGTVYGYIANPKYAAGFDSDGLIGCGSGRPPINYSSHSDNVGLWRKRGAQYAGASGRLLKWQLAMIRLKYARKGNSGTIEGCTGYNYQYTAAAGESGVKRVLLTAAQAANLFVGSSVIIGDKGTGTSADRGVASMYKLAKNKRIASITDVTIGGTAYKAVNIETDTAFDTEAGVTYISTMPYWSGWNDTEEELAEIKAQEEQKEMERLAKQRKREKAYREKRKAKKIAENGGEIVKKKVCPHCGKEFTPASNRQIFCTKECCNQARQDKVKADRVAEKGDHYYRQRQCEVCGSIYWPTHSQQKFCSEKCKRINHNKKTLEFYHKKQKEKAQCKDLSQMKEPVSSTNSSEITTIPA